MATNLGWVRAYLKRLFSRKSIGSYVTEFYEIMGLKTYLYSHNAYGQQTCQGGDVQ